MTWVKNALVGVADDGKIPTPSDQESIVKFAAIAGRVTARTSAIRMNLELRAATWTPTLDLHPRSFHPLTARKNDGAAVVDGGSIMKGARK